VEPNGPRVQQPQRQPHARQVTQVPPCSVGWFHGVGSWEETSAERFGEIIKLRVPYVMYYSQKQAIHLSVVWPARHWKQSSYKLILPLGQAYLLRGIDAWINIVTSLFSYWKNKMLIKIYIYINLIGFFHLSHLFVFCKSIWWIVQP
jgi:hypothetical protein